MVEYEKLKDEQDLQHSQSLLNDSNGEDGHSSSDESTIIARPFWMDSFYHDRRFISMRTVIFFLLTLVIMLGSIVLFLAWIVVDLKAFHKSAGNGIIEDSAHFHSIASKTGISTCGSSSAEAIAAGCHFDIFSFGWYPRECTDLQLYNESMDVFHSQIGDASAFFLRPSVRSEPSYSNYEVLPLSVLKDYALGENSIHGIMTDHQEVLGTWEQYLVACSYSWQKVQRAAMRNWPLDEWSSSYALASRCGQDLLHREKRESESIMWHLKPWFPKCGLEAEDLQREIAAALRQ
ncbi:hypothetical protein G7Y89_g14882 [Cudoniella acicularis]|uniref:Uncharacterized protein n=1 Tax=Cudoniella acicularis TaxID=354080 RepID=A0A8H4QVT5_9HELO|nr:hypothetical protein G7Y89_g14882 [Cudoniella acicularis]